MKKSNEQRRGNMKWLPMDAREVCGKILIQIFQWIFCFLDDV
jgi:hypothetical protein